MSAESVVIKGGRVVDADGERVADVIVVDGRIAAVGADLSADRTLDATGCIVSPGLVDIHSHLREPGKEEAETVETGARGAALGGYTAILAMPNTVPAIDSAAVVQQVLNSRKRRLTRSRQSSQINSSILAWAPRRGLRLL